MDERRHVPGARFLYRASHLTMEGGCDLDHGPRVVAVGPIEVDRFPVTNGRYAAFLRDTGYAPGRPASYLRHWPGGSLPAGQEALPVVWVSPEDAAAFAGWAGGRLPTDEEWQYLAAGPEYRPWPWGNRFDAGMCNHDGAGLKPVHAHPDGASWCGCEDMCGNAWEWTLPIHDDGHHRFGIVRGGCWYRAQDHWHVAGGARPTDFHWKVQLLNTGLNRSETVGFRCVYEAAP